MHLLKLLVSGGAVGLWLVAMVAAASAGLYLTRLAARPGLTALKGAGVTVLCWAALSGLAPLVWRLAQALVAADRIPSHVVPLLFASMRAVGSGVDLVCFGLAALLLRRATKEG